MRIAARVFIKTTITLTALLLMHSVSNGQELTSPTTSASSQSPGDKDHNDPQAAAAPPQAAKPQPAEQDFWTREEMTGDWGETRSRWKDKGFEIDLRLTQFFQGVAAGGIETGSEYNGKFQTAFKFDLGKLGGWKFWQAELKTETRFGGPLLTGTGTISPVNTAEIVPGADGTVFSITAINVTKLFPINLGKGDFIAIS